MKAEIYWIPEVPVGALAIVGRPRAGDWLADEILGWKTAGLTDIVSLLEDWEIRDLELTREASLAEQIGLSFQRFPIPDRGVPSSPPAAHELWNALATKLRAGASVGVHCRAGIGRSGLITAGVLLRLGVAQHEVWHRLTKARGLTVPDTDDQRRWLNAQFDRNAPNS